jgi:hypothetical protein
VDNRIRCGRNAFYSLQGIGLCAPMSTSADTIAYIWNTAIKPVFTYGLECVTLSKNSLLSLERMQTKLLKAALGINKFCKNTPILQALKIQKMQLSRATTFYLHMMNLSSHKNLIYRSKTICAKYGIPFLKFIIDDKYAKKAVCDIKNRFPTNDGLVDTVKQLLMNQDRKLLNMMLMPF